MALRSSPCTNSSPLLPHFGKFFLHFAMIRLDAVYATKPQPMVKNASRARKPVSACPQFWILLALQKSVFWTENRSEICKEVCEASMTGIRRSLQGFHSDSCTGEISQVQQNPQVFVVHLHFWDILDEKMAKTLHREILALGTALFSYY